jgi:PAS domain-containing protein
MNGERPESAIRHGNPRALSLGGQSILLGAALLIGTSVVGWMALNAMGSAAIWRSAGVVSTALAVLVLNMALAWRLVAQCRGILDELVLAGARGHGRPEPSLGREAAPRCARGKCLQLGSQNSARRAEDLKRSSLKRLRLAIDLRGRAVGTAIRRRHSTRSSVSTRGKIIAFNAAAEATFGYQAAEAIGQDLAGLIVPSDCCEPIAEGWRVLRLAKDRF